MNYPDYMDADMRELVEALGKAIVPRNRRPAVFRVNKHSPYYSDRRWTRL